MGRASHAQAHPGSNRFQATTPGVMMSFLRRSRSKPVPFFHVGGQFGHMRSPSILFLVLRDYYVPIAECYLVFLLAGLS